MMTSRNPDIQHYNEDHLRYQLDRCHVKSTGGSLFKRALTSLIILSTAFLVARLNVSRAESVVAAVAPRDKPNVVMGSLNHDLNLTCKLPGGRQVMWFKESETNRQDRVLIKSGVGLQKFLISEQLGICTGNKSTCSQQRNHRFSTLTIHDLNEGDDGLYACYTITASERFEVKLFIPISGLTLSVMHTRENQDDVTFENVHDHLPIVGIANETLVVCCNVARSRPPPYFVVQVQTASSIKRYTRPMTRFYPVKELYDSSPNEDGHSYATKKCYKTDMVRVDDNEGSLSCEVWLPEVLDSTNIGIGGDGNSKYRAVIRRHLIVRYAPMCVPPLTNVPKLVAINRSNSITCPILKSNPVPTLYQWLSVSPGTVVGSLDQEVISFRPENGSNIEPLRCSASNSIGQSPVCIVPLLLGGYPDPVTDCEWSFPANRTLQITCQLGFHQGDIHQQCVLFRYEPENEMMIEYSRAKHCTFMITGINPAGHHRLQVYSINKFGDSMRNAIEIEINGPPSAIDADFFVGGRMTTVMVFLGCSITIAIAFLCCCLSATPRKKGRWYNFRSFTTETCMENPYGKAVSTEYKPLTLGSTIADLMMIPGDYDDDDDDDDDGGGGGGSDSPRNQLGPKPTPRRRKSSISSKNTKLCGDRSRPSHDNHYTLNHNLLPDLKAFNTNPPTVAPRRSTHLNLGRKRSTGLETRLLVADMPPAYVRRQQLLEIARAGTHNVAHEELLTSSTELETDTKNGSTLERTSTKVTEC